MQYMNGTDIGSDRLDGRESFPQQTTANKYWVFGNYKFGHPTYFNAITYCAKWDTHMGKVLGKVLLQVREEVNKNCWFSSYG